MRIALDAMGGDFAPKATVAGAVLAARELKLGVVLVGDRTTIQRELGEHEISGLDLTIEHASEIVTMDDSPVESIVTKANSSIHVAYELLKRGDVSGVVSAGNSGAVMMAGMVILGNLPGVDRPALAPFVPSGDGFALLIDVGANAEVKPYNLVQFAIIGSVYTHHVRKIARPRVGILSIGEEDSKGTDLTRAANATLREMSAYLNYIGYVEGRDINKGNVDVVVTDGFTGNVVLKTLEGFEKFLMGKLREVFTSGMMGRIGYLLVRKRLGAMREHLDPRQYGGAPLLGVNGVAIVAHGSSDPVSIRNAIRTAAEEAANKQINREIIELLRKAPQLIPAKAENKGIRALFTKMRERLHRKRDGEQAAAAGVVSGDARKPATGSLKGHTIQKLEGPKTEAPGAESSADPVAHDQAKDDLQALFIDPVPNLEGASHSMNGKDSASAGDDLLPESDASHSATSAPGVKPTADVPPGKPNNS